MPNGWFGQQRNPLDLFGGGKTALQTLQRYPDRPKREAPVPVGWKRRLGGAAAAFAARFGGGPGAGTRVGEQIVGAPRRAQEAEYQRGLEEWEAGRTGAEEAYTLERQSEADRMRREQHGRQMQVPIPATPQRAHEYRMEERRPPTPSTRVMGTETKQYDPATGEWKRVGPAPVYPGREPQRHPSMLQQWLSSQMAGLARLRNDPMGDPAVVAQEERRIIEQYNQQAPSYGVAPITELPGAAGQRQPDENDPLGIL